MKTLKIVKIGGNIIDDSIALDDFLMEFAKISSPKILVHGGGKLATRLANKLGVKVNKVDGRRITDADTLEIITQVYAGKINKNIVAKMQAQRCNALGFTGADGNTIVAVKRPVKEIDFGFVGDIVHVNTEVLEALLQRGVTPVFCAITHDEKGQLLNTNADTIAAELAIGLAQRFSTELYYCFEKNGVLTNVNDQNSVITHIDSAMYTALIKNKIVSEGMLPKTANGFHALKNGVFKVCMGKPSMLFNKNSTFTTLQL